MKNWQFCMLMATIYLAPFVSGWVNILGGAVFLIGSVIELVRERK